MLPLRGVSALDTADGLFADAAADDALLTAVREGLTDSTVGIVELDLHINDEAFGRSAADRLHNLITQQKAGTTR